MDLSAGLDSVEQESDTDVLSPPIMVAQEADMAIDEISALLCEIPSMQPQRLVTPEPGCQRTLTSAEQPVPVHLLDLLRPLFQVDLPTWYPAEHGQWHRVPPSTMMPMLILQLYMALLFTAGWETAKPQTVALYHTVATEPFRAPSPSQDLENPVDSLSWGDLVEREEQEAAARATTPADPVDVRPVLQDLDVIHAVRMAHPGQVDHKADTSFSNQHLLDRSHSGWVLSMS